MRPCGWRIAADRAAVQARTAADGTGRLRPERSDAGSGWERYTCPTDYGAAAAGKSAVHALRLLSAAGVHAGKRPSKQPQTAYRRYAAQHAFMPAYGMPHALEQSAQTVGVSVPRRILYIERCVQNGSCHAGCEDSGAHAPRVKEMQTGISLPAAIIP